MNEEMTMLRLRTLSAGLIALAGSVAAAAAADLGTPAYTPAPEAAANQGFTWTGPEVGALLGYGFGQSKVGSTKSSADGVTGGAYAGYNFATANFLFGVEGDITASGMSGGNGAFTVSNPWNGTLRARAGFTIDRVLLYGTGGLAFGDVTVKNAGSSDSAVQTGWTGGFGAEAAVTNNIVGRVEYRYTDLGSHNFATTPAASASFTSNQIFAGVGLKF
jgi:outer membrane immunogenic protein